MHSKCLLMLFSSIMEIVITCDSFIFDSTNATSVSTSTYTDTQTPITATTSEDNISKLTHPSGNISLTSTPTPDKQYHQLINILIDERHARAQLEQKLVELQRNFSDVLDGFEIALNSTDETHVLERIDDLERSFNVAFTDVTKNVSDLNADQKDLAIHCVNMTNMSLPSDIRYQLNNLTVETHLIQDELLAVTNKTGLQAGFTVTRPTSGPTTGTITFQTVITNVNDDYNITSGTFTCSINGVYFFVLTMYKYSIADFAYCNIRHNGTDVVEAYSNPNVKGDYGFYSASTTLYIHLESGDTIDLGHCTAAGTLEYRTTFTGFLVNAD